MNRAYVPPDISAALVLRARETLANRFGVADWIATGEPLGARKSLVQRLASPSSGRMAALKFYQLPRAARDYVEWVEEQIGVPIELLSVGPEREAVIPRKL